MDITFTFEVHTPYRLFFSGRVESFSLTLLDGEIGVHKNRLAFFAPVVTCILRIKDNKGQIRSAFITDGVLEVKEFNTVLMVETAEWPEEIDTERAQTAKQNAQEDLEAAMLKFEVDNAKAKLRRAEFRLKAAALNNASPDIL